MYKPNDCFSPATSDNDWYKPGAKGGGGVGGGGVGGGGVGGGGDGGGGNGGGGVGGGGVGGGGVGGLCNVAKFKLHFVISPGGPEVIEKVLVPLMVV